MAAGSRYEGVGWTLEDAVREAHSKAPNRRDGQLELGMTRLVEVRIQRNGFAQSVSFHVVVEEDLTTVPWAEPPHLVGV